MIEERSVGADLGADSIQAGKVACIIAMVGDRRGDGRCFTACSEFSPISHCIFNGILTLAGLSVLGATLTLPGIAGIVLTLGMAVDANVLILERVREEHAQWPLEAVTAMEFGYREALGTIVDSHVTTLISTMLLFLFGTGPIKGFAVTLLDRRLHLAVHRAAGDAASDLGLAAPHAAQSAAALRDPVPIMWKPIRLVPPNTRIDFMRWHKFTFGLAV